MIAYIKQRFPRGEFARNVLTLMTGTTIAQAIPIAISPILTRIYTPNDFGIFALYTSVASLISVIATGRYEMAVMLPEEDEDAINIVWLSLMISSGISILSLIIVWLFNAEIVSLLGTNKISHWLYFVPLTVFLTGVYQTFNYWSNRRKQIKRLASSRVSQTASTAAFNLGLGLIQKNAAGLIEGAIVGQAIANSVFGWQIWRQDKNYIKNISFNRIKDNAAKYKDFPMINSLHAFVDMIQSSGISWLLSAFFSSTVLGFYSFTFRMLKAPLALIGASFAQIFYQAASDTYKREGDLYGLTKKTVMKLFVIAIPIFTMIILFAPSLFEIVFGEEWRKAGIYAQILSPWLFVNFLISPVSQLPIILNRQRTSFFINLTNSSSVLLIIGICSYMKINIFWTLGLMSVCATFITLLYGGWMLKLTKNLSSLANY